MRSRKEAKADLASIFNWIVSERSAVSRSGQNRHYWRRSRTVSGSGRPSKPSSSASYASAAPAAPVPAAASIGALSSATAASSAAPVASPYSAIAAGGSPAAAAATSAPPAAAAPPSGEGGCIPLWRRPESSLGWELSDTGGLGILWRS